ncbi:hypothetical protein CBL_03830 [Carabus blaptoides fortunei]
MEEGTAASECRHQRPLVLYVAIILEHVGRTMMNAQCTILLSGLLYLDVSHSPLVTSTSSYKTLSTKYIWPADGAEYVDSMMSVLSSSSLQPVRIGWMMMSFTFGAATELLLLRRARWKARNTRTEMLRAPQSSTNCQSQPKAGAEWGSK